MNRWSVGFLAAMTLAGCRIETTSEPAPAPVAEEMTTMQLRSRMAASLAEARGIAPAGISALVLEDSMFYDRTNVPVPGFYTGTFHALMDESTDRRHWFDSLGTYLFDVRPGPLEGTWAGERFDPDGHLRDRFVYRKEGGVREQIYWERPTSDGLLLRERAHYPIYRLEGGQATEQAPYALPDHGEKGDFPVSCLLDRGRGTFFEPTHELVAGDSVVSEIGNLYLYNRCTPLDQDLDPVLSVQRAPPGFHFVPANPRGVQLTLDELSAIGEQIPEAYR